MRNFKILSVLIGGIVLLLFSIMGYVFYQNFREDTINQAMLREQQIHFLFSFEFEYNDQQSAILNYMIVYSSKTKKVGILEIPSQLGVFDNEKEALFPLSYYLHNFGKEKYVEAIRELLYIEEMPYLFVSSDALGDFIDIIGGIEIPISGNLVAFDLGDGRNEFSNQYTIFNKKIFLDGIDVSPFLWDIESRAGILNKNDYTLSSRRMSFILALIEALKSRQDIIQNATIVKHIASSTYTNISTDNLQSILGLPQNFEKKKTYFQILQGDMDTVSLKGQNYFILFIDNISGSVNKVFSLLRDFVEKEVLEETNTNISLTILNGTLLNGLAGTTKEIYQQDEIFSILGVGNAISNNIQYSVVLDRIGNKQKAQKVAERIGVKTIVTDIAVLDNVGAEITLILGEDFDGKAVSE